MGLSEAERVCKDHPYHDERLGVCPSCLRDKLSQLHGVFSFRESPSCYSSSSVSTHLSPVHRHQRHGSDSMGSVSFRISLGLNKSKSMAFVPTEHNHNKKKKKKGFWSNILHPHKQEKELPFYAKV